MKVLLINPSWRESSYLNTKVKAATLSHPPVSLAIIAADLLRNGFKAMIFDMDVAGNPFVDLKETLKGFSPDYVGITGTTPYASQMINIAEFVKGFDSRITTVIGGVHATSMPHEFTGNDSVDIVVYGEGDFTLTEIIKNRERLSEVKGIHFKRGKEVVTTPPRPLLDNLDELPLPAWHLYDLDKYKGSHLISKVNPVGPIETSRGCVFGCVYCNKNIFQRRFRPKSVKRTVDEMEFMLESGFRELHIEDEGFSTDMKRAKDICDEIVRRGLRFHWQLFAGLRVDRIDMELALKLKRAGCYRIAFGVESGNQRVLDTINKGTTLKQVEEAVKITKAAGIESFGFFMLGLPGDTEKSMQETIDFARRLDMDVVKFDITIPYPGTRLYSEWDSKGLIKKRDWKLYLQHASDSRIYDHPNLSWDALEKYYKKSFREYYLRPSYIIKRGLRSIKKGELFKDISAFLRTSW